MQTSPVTTRLISKEYSRSILVLVVVMVVLVAAAAAGGYIHQSPSTQQPTSHHLTSDPDIFPPDFPPFLSSSPSNPYPLPSSPSSPSTHSTSSTVPRDMHLVSELTPFRNVFSTTIMIPTHLTLLLQLQREDVRLTSIDIHFARRSHL
ncbi:hypothetical protein E2C01_009506 [Portunus trituberculatus]|uniref:Uncharacterized protein n=1 Tax=Portunus trituberculatus TaxID=210409 RepID=A0A5B7D5Z1_PORTR|nr:hypothetical protein [Portunus trituberculatus]